MSSTLVLVLVLALALFGAQVVWKGSATRRRSRALTDAVALQEFVLRKTDELDAVLADASLSRSERASRARSIVTAMESRNVRGELDDFIAATRATVEEKLGPRDAA